MFRIKLLERKVKNDKILKMVHVYKLLLINKGGEGCLIYKMFDVI